MFWTATPPYCILVLFWVYPQIWIWKWYVVSIVHVIGWISIVDWVGVFWQIGWSFPNLYFIYLRHGFLVGVLSNDFIEIKHGYPTAFVIETLGVVTTLFVMKKYLLNSQKYFILHGGNHLMVGLANCSI